MWKIELSPVDFESEQLCMLFQLVLPTKPVHLKRWWDVFRLRKVVEYKVKGVTEHFKIT